MKPSPLYDPESDCAGVPPDPEVAKDVVGKPLQDEIGDEHPHYEPVLVPSPLSNPSHKVLLTC